MHRLRVYLTLLLLLVLAGSASPAVRAQDDDKQVVPGMTASTLHPYPGQTITVVWSNAPTSYWIGLYAAGANNADYQQERYVSGANGSAPFQIPWDTATGNYELRMFADKAVTRITTSPNLSIAPATPYGTISHVWSSLSLGSFQTFNWTLSPQHGNDQIRVYLDGDTSNYYALCYTNGNASGQMGCYLDPNAAWPAIPGNYAGCLLSGVTGQIVVCDSSFGIPY